MKPASARDGLRRGEQLALAAFVWCSLATHALYAQETRPGRARFSRPLLDAPGPGYFEQRDRFAPGETALRVRMPSFFQVVGPPFSLLRISERQPMFGTLSSGASFGILAGEFPNGRQERLEFDRRFEELKARLEKMSAP